MLHIPTQVTAYPGEEVQLGIEATDELGRPTATILRLSDVSLR